MTCGPKVQDPQPRRIAGEGLPRVAGRSSGLMAVESAEGAPLSLMLNVLWAAGDEVVVGITGRRTRKNEGGRRRSEEEDRIDLEKEEGKVEV